MVNQNHGWEYRTIWFWNDKTVECEYDYNAMSTTMDELKAINKKCEELGWL